MIILAYILILIIAFYLQARIRKTYFSDALERISVRLHANDSAASLLKSFSSTAPKLFIVLFALLHSGGKHEAIGIGTVIGSVLFGTLAVTGTAAFTKRIVSAWQPLVRNLSFFILSALLLLKVFHTGKITILDVAFCIALYIMFALIVINWHRITDYADPNEIIKPQEEKKTYIQRLINVMKRPVDFITDKIFPPKKYYWLVFFVGLTLIAGLSWVLTESAIRIAQLSAISENLIGLAVLAVGIGVPDIMKALSNSRKGEGNKSMLNTLSVSIFDMLIGLGVPFLAFILISGGSILSETNKLTESILLIPISAIVILGLFFAEKKRIGKYSGVLLILLYLLYLARVIITI